MTRVGGAWLDAAGTQAVMGMLEDGGHRAFAVGGCVRNALLGVAVSDVDISTDARPERVIELAEAAGLKAVPTGIDHGTVTVVAEGTGYEVTTFRADVETDGRRAVVRFSDDIAEDARRRDFTMNALYSDRYGGVHDPLGGLPDLRARRLRFIEDPERRIREDYLRILRFFRFFAWYADPGEGADAEALAAIAANLDGLDLLSRERVGAELLKLLTAPDPFAAVCLMARAGVLARVLPGATEAGLGPLLLHEATLGLGPEPMRRLAVLGPAEDTDLRLSKAQQGRLDLLCDLMGGGQGPAEMAWRHGAGIAESVLALRAASFGTSLPDDVGEKIAKGASARFPIDARDLMPEFEGPALGAAMKELESLWIETEFRLDKPALLARWRKG